MKPWLPNDLTLSHNKILQEINAETKNKLSKIKNILAGKNLV